MRILLLSAYHSASHRYWCEGLMAALPEIEWTLKTQPARYFSWRVRASGWIWGLAEDEDFARRPDLVIATSLTGLTALRALCPALAGVPLWVYFHENQFAHPRHAKQLEVHRANWQFHSLQNALLADRVSFNTAFNRDTFLAGAETLLRQLPEKLPGDPVESVREKSDVLPVPLTDEFAGFRSAPKDPNLIVWNHRWEWDKRPEVFLGALLALHREGIDFKLAMMGSGGGRGDVFASERAELEPHLVHWGEADPATYRKWIARAGVGASTALHDFQGLALLEAAQAGARVVAPRRLAYPEVLPGAEFYEGAPDDPAVDQRDFQEVLRRVLADKTAPAKAPPVPGWTRLAARYRERMRTFNFERSTSNVERLRPNVQSSKFEVQRSKFPNSHSPPPP